MNKVEQIGYVFQLDGIKTSTITHNVAQYY